MFRPSKFQEIPSYWKNNKAYIQYSLPGKKEPIYHKTVSGWGMGSCTGTVQMLLCFVAWPSRGPTRAMPGHNSENCTGQRLLSLSGMDQTTVFEGELIMPCHLLKESENSPWPTELTSIEVDFRCLVPKAAVV